LRQEGKKKMTRGIGVLRAGNGNALGKKDRKPSRGFRVERAKRFSQQRRQRI